MGEETMLIYVCDDNPGHQRNIGQLIERFFSDRKVACRIEYFLEGQEMLELSEQEKVCVDAAFIDIEIGEESGIDVAKELLKRHKCSYIIYVSSHKEYVFDVFETSPVDYLVKPLDEQRVLRTLERIYEKERLLKKINLMVGRRGLEIDVDTILYIQSKGRVLHIYTKNDEILTYEKMDGILQRLNEIKPGFIRIHKSYIVNYDHVKAFKGNEVKMDNGLFLNISRPYREAVKKYSIKYIEHKIHNIE